MYHSKHQMKDLYLEGGNYCCYQIPQEAAVRTGHGTMDWFQTGKGGHEGCILYPAY